MLRKTLVLLPAAVLAALALSSKAQAWGAYHAGFTHYSPYTGLHHYGYTEAYRGFGGYGEHRYGAYGYHYGGYHYGAYGAYGARYGFYRRW
jgi:hypothetical protein